MNLSAANIVPFGFEDHTIRTLTDENGEPLFVAKDIAVALGYQNTNDAIKQHCRGVVICYPISDSLGRPQDARVIKEPDVYRLIIKSTLPSAVKFEEWLMEEVLPAIRKTGAYQAQQAPMSPGDMLVAQAEAFRAMERKLASVATQGAENASRLDQIETAGEHFTIIGWARLNGRQVTLPMASSMGGKASKHCRANGIQTGSVPDARYGRANTYPKNVLDYLFGGEE